jgi:GT2 family glycosyltransferase
LLDYACVSISVVVAVSNAPEDLAACLAGIRACRGAQQAELVVVDDASNYASAIRISALATKFGAKLIRLDRRSGPAAARNAGAQASQAEIILFLDADVVPHPDCLELVGSFLAGSKQHHSAVIGSYDTHPDHPALVSQYRNLLHAYVHQTSEGEVASFWTGCGAVRRSAFLAAGGFDAKFQFPSVEDVEFGSRLVRTGCRITLDSRIQVTHRKRWTLRSMLETDLLRRSVPWTMLALSGVGFPRNLNFTPRRRASVIVSALIAAFGVLSIVDLRFCAAITGALAALICLNLPFLGWLKNQRGLTFACSCLSLHWLHCLTQAAGCAIGSLAVAATWVWFRRWPGVSLPKLLRQLSG